MTDPVHDKMRRYWTIPANVPAFTWSLVRRPCAVSINVARTGNKEINFHIAAETQRQFLRDTLKQEIGWATKGPKDYRTVGIVVAGIAVFVVLGLWVWFFISVY